MIMGRSLLKSIFVILIIPFSLSAGSDWVKLWFKNGGYVYCQADSYWTQYHWNHNKYEFYEAYPEHTIDNNAYLCFWDWVSMNPVSHDTKKADFTRLRDAIQATGNEAHYFIRETTVQDDWGVSVRYDQLDSVYTYYPYNSSICLYKDGQKYH